MDMMDEVVLGQHLGVAAHLRLDKLGEGGIHVRVDRGEEQSTLGMGLRILHRDHGADIEGRTGSQNYVI